MSLCNSSCHVVDATPNFASRIYFLGFCGKWIIKNDKSGQEVNFTYMKNVEYKCILSSRQS